MCFFERCLLLPGAVALELFLKGATEVLPSPIVALFDLAESLAARSFPKTEAQAVTSRTRARVAVVIACDETSKPDLAG